jgi:hypothetical protein
LSTKRAFGSPRNVSTLTKGVIIAALRGNDLRLTAYGNIPFEFGAFVKLVVSKQIP